MIEADVLQMISNYGFPIVMCLLIWYQSNTAIKKNTEAINELTALIRGKL